MYSYCIIVTNRIVLLSCFTLLFWGIILWGGIVYELSLFFVLLFRMFRFREGWGLRYNDRLLKWREDGEILWIIILIEGDESSSSSRHIVLIAFFCMVWFWHHKSEDEGWKEPLWLQIWIFSLIFFFDEWRILLISEGTSKHRKNDCLLYFPKF